MYIPNHYEQFSPSVDLFLLMSLDTTGLYNPINYVIDGLTSTEYQQLVKLAETANQSFD